MTSRRTFALTLVVAGSAVLAASGDRSPAVTTTTRQADRPRVGRDSAADLEVAKAYGRLPMMFEANRGQTDPRVDFAARGKGYAIFLTSGGGATLVLSPSERSNGGRNCHAVGSRERLRVMALRHEAAAASAPGLPCAGVSETQKGAAVRLVMDGASTQVRGVGQDRLQTQVNYLTGRERSAWHEKIPTFGKVIYRDAYPGIDVVYYGNQQELEFDFMVAPGATPNDIRFHFEGADEVTVGESGELVVSVAGRYFTQRAPVVYQETAAGRRIVDGQYVVSGSKQVSVDVGAYDSSLPLVIDPVLVYSTFVVGVSGPSDDFGYGIALDGAGNAYVVGSTRGFDFPTTAGAFDTTFNVDMPTGGGDVFVAKLNTTGTGLEYGTYLGGTRDDGGFGIAVDAAGNAYVTGYTSSTDFPTRPGAFDTTMDGDSDGFVVKLNTTGTGLEYGTYLGGASSDGGSSIAVDAAGSAYVTGFTTSSDFPTTPGAFDVSFEGSGTSDAFVSKLNATGTSFDYSTYLAGASQGVSITVDSAGAAYVMGQTFDFPTTPGAFDTTANGGVDVFVVKLTTDGTGLEYSTYLGGMSDDLGFGIAVDAAGSAYVTGNTFSTNFPTTLGSFDTTANGGLDVFIVKLNANGTDLEYSTYLGGTNSDRGFAIALDAVGSAYVTGDTSSSNFPTTPGAFDTTSFGDGDVFVIKLNTTGTGLEYGTYLGGHTGEQWGFGIAVGAGGNVYVTGYTESSSFRTTSGDFDGGSSGGLDAFVTQVNNTGSNLFYSVVMGGSVAEIPDQSLAIAVDSDGAAFISGTTNTVDFPATAGAFDPHASNLDAFVVKVAATGSDIVYATYLGGDAHEAGRGVAVDAAGSAYVTGYTRSTNFPTTPGAFNRTYSGDTDVFVVKLNATGTRLEYGTYVGGTNLEFGFGIAVDATGSAYITGYSQSRPFPSTPEAFDPIFDGGEVFVIKLNATGTGLDYGTSLGGRGFEMGLGITVDAAGSAYVTGFTTANDFPTTPGAFDVTGGGPETAFVTKLNTTGTGLDYSTYLDLGQGSGIAVDVAGNAYVTGLTRPTPSRSYDIFVVKLNTTGTGLEFGTYLGGTGTEGRSSGIAVDAAGRAYVTGSTYSIDFPTTPGAFDTTLDGDSDMFFVKLNAAGSNVEYSTYLGGASGETGSGIAVDAAGNAYVTGHTSSPDFPTTPGAFDTTLGAGTKGFVIKFGEDTYSLGPCLGEPGHAVLPPLSTDGTSVFQRGRTVPVKFRVCDANGRSVGHPGVVSSFSLVADEPGIVLSPTNDTLAATSRALFRWDPIAQQWILNLSTRDLASGRTYFYRITLDDGSAILFQFAIK